VGSPVVGIGRIGNLQNGIGLMLVLPAALYEQARRRRFCNCILGLAEPASHQVLKEHGSK
ncbi:hypothetical protein MYX78_05910, partial [Acidobacteria bacterium AH-259-G07]|nr:hypothetical protein [Acidobacteria bacterium AH-259-G07]